MSHAHTDRREMALVNVLAARSIAEIGPKIADRIRYDVHGPVVLTPSSLRATDEGSAAIETALDQNAVQTEVLVPRRSVSVAVSRIAGSNPPAWQSIHVGSRHYRLDERLQSNGYIAVLTLTASLRRGPFVLDLPTQFLHPADRMRLIADHRRRLLIADVAALAMPAMTVIVTAAGGGFLALMTRDPIAAELCALAIAEQYFDPALESQGPWEDASVQRATELDLGARIPADICFVYEGVNRDQDTVPPMLRRIGSRLGVTFDDRR